MPDAVEFANATISTHAAVEAARRRISEVAIRAVLADPGSVETVRPGRVVLTSHEGRSVLRVFVDVDREPPVVVTVYRSSKIRKYWSSQ